MFAKYTCLATVLAIAGCASAPPPELKDARAEYLRASHGDAARFDPGGLRVAHEALANADRTFADRGDDDATKDMAYAAKRRAQIAEATARIRVAQHARELANEQVKVTSARLEAKHAEEAIPVEVKKQMDALQAAALDQKAEMERANTRGAQAEERAERAKEEVTKLARVTHEARGTVYTIEAADLFEPYNANLLPDATSRFGALADAIRGEHPSATIRVEAYSDTEGGDETNKWITKQRAEAVRDQLLARGFSADRVAALGMGAVHPVASNSTDQGKAANRRIEIVVVENKP